VYNAISLIEVTYLIEKEGLPSTALERIEKVLNLPIADLVSVPLTLEICCTMIQIPRADVPDMPDAFCCNCVTFGCLPLVTRDRQIHASQIQRIR
jgi:hypothetical protein